MHHRDHDHDNNPPDGSNWELLCVYCHDNEHSRLIDGAYGDLLPNDKAGAATHNPFADLASRLKKRNSGNPYPGGGVYRRWNTGFNPARCARGAARAGALFATAWTPRVCGN